MNTLWKSIFLSISLSALALALPACTVASPQPTSSYPADTLPAVSSQQNTPSLPPATTPSATQAPHPTSTPVPTTAPSLTPEPQGFPPVLYPSWKSFTNGNYIRKIIVAQDGTVWTVGNGGAVQWNQETGEYVKYTTEHGLAGNFIVAAAQTPDGALWFGTRTAGVSRFDGTHWITYTDRDGLPTNYVLSMAVAPDGSMLVSLDNDWEHEAEMPGGLMRFDGQSWEQVSPDTFEVFAITPDGKIWGGNYERGLVQVNAETGERIGVDLPDYRVTALTVDREGKLWVATRTALLQFDGQAWRQLPPLARMEDSDHIDAPLIEAIAVGEDGTVWLGFSFALKMWEATDREDLEGMNFSGQGEGVYRYQDGGWTLLSTQDGLVDNEIRAITVGGDGKVWFGSYRQGMSLFDGSSWRTYQTEDELLSNVIGSVAVAGADEVWVGHYFGASHLIGNEWTPYMQMGDLGDPKVTSVVVAQDQSVWFSTRSGAARWIGGTWTTYPAELYEEIGYLYDIQLFPDGGLLFTSVTNGMSIFDGVDFTFIPNSEYKGLGRAFIDPDGRIWTWDYYGIHLHYGSVWALFPEKDTSISGDDIRFGGVGPDGRLWFISCSEILRYDGKEWQTDQAIRDLNAGCPIGGMVVDAHGDVWIGFRQGLGHFDGQEWELLQTPGLADRQILDLKIGPYGALWIATHAGLSRYSP